MKKINSGIATYKARDFQQKVMVDPLGTPKDMPHEERSKTELLSWWQLPYVVSGSLGFEVRVLDSGTHDRTRSLGFFKSVEEAIECARTYQPLLSTYLDIDDIKAAGFDSFEDIFACKD